MVLVSGMTFTSDFFTATDKVFCYSLLLVYRQIITIRFYCSFRFELTVKKVVIFIVVVVVAVAVGVGLYFGLREDPVQLRGGAVVANGAECAQIGV